MIDLAIMNRSPVTFPSLLNHTSETLLGVRTILHKLSTFNILYLFSKIFYSLSVRGLLEFLNFIPIILTFVHEKYGESGISIQANVIK